MQNREGQRYLDPAALAKIGNLELIAKFVVEGFISGLHKSPYHGFSVEFAQYRQYMPCLLYTSPSPRDRTRSRMPSSA